MSENLEVAHAALASAKRRRADAEQQVAQALLAMDRAAAIVGDCRQTLNRFGHLDQEIAAAHSDAIKTFARVGGERPSLAVPVSLSARAEAKLKAQQEMNAATCAFDALKTEWTAAQELLQARKIMVSNAACAVLLQEYDAIAGLLEDAQTKVFELMPRLRAVGAFWPPHRNQSLRLSQRALDCLYRTEPQYPPFDNADMRAAAEIKIRFEQLCA